MKKSFIYIIICLVFSLVSCTENDDDKVVKIGFTKIVGNYNGISKFCNSMFNTMDTICSPFENNVLNVVIFDQSSIHVDDTKDYFFKTKLVLQSSTMKNGEQFHNFSSKDAVNEFNLIYNETLNTISAIKKSQVGNMLNYDIFEGQK